MERQELLSAESTAAYHTEYLTQKHVGAGCSREQALLKAALRQA